MVDALITGEEGSEESSRASCVPLSRKASQPSKRDVEGGSRDFAGGTGFALEAGRPGSLNPGFKFVTVLALGSVGGDAFFGMLPSRGVPPVIEGSLNVERGVSFSAPVGTQFFATCIGNCIL